jgi:hypothetical protein
MWKIIIDVIATIGCALEGIIYPPVEHETLQNTEDDGDIQSIRQSS